MNTLTLDDHKELALCLHEIRDRVSAIMRITHPKLPKRSRASENIWKLQRSVDQVKCLLDSLMYIKGGAIIDHEAPRERQFVAVQK
jgi:hypothetical protein